jgi:hypothetical protein
MASRRLAGGPLHFNRVIELQSDELIFAFPDLREPLRVRVRGWVDERLDSATNEEKNMLPSSREEVHRTFAACLPRISASVSFQRTLRMPENGQHYPMPLGLGRFPVYPVDDFAGVPEAWRLRGGIMLPLHPTEALWLGFYADYPMALRIGVGGKCAVCGEPSAPLLRSTPQNYVVLGSQPWLDGFHAGPEVVRQFVAKPLGQGILGVHALSGEERWGGLQLQAIPLSAAEYWRQILKEKLTNRWDELMTPIHHRTMQAPVNVTVPPDWTVRASGKLRLKIMDDPYGATAWDPSLSSRCFAHLCLAADWERLTGIRPPQKPPTREDYSAAGLPWVESNDGAPRPGSKAAWPVGPDANQQILESIRQEESGYAAVAPRQVVRLNPDLRQVVREF